jgi:uncharacterized protein YpbB
MEKMSPPAQETIRLLAQGKTFEEIAQIRYRQLASVITLVADLIEEGRLEFQPAWIAESKQTQIEAACATHGTDRLRAIKDALPEETTYDEIRLVVAAFRRRQKVFEQTTLTRFVSEPGAEFAGEGARATLKTHQSPSHSAQ